MGHDPLPSPTGDEGDDDVGSVAIEVLPPSVIDRGRPWIRVASGDLDITKRNARIECGHDEGGPEHVRVHGVEPRLLAD